MAANDGVEWTCRPGLRRAVRPGSVGLAPAAARAPADAPELVHCPGRPRAPKGTLSAPVTLHTKAAHKASFPVENTDD
jgi:hypothetical protein